MVTGPGRSVVLHFHQPGCGACEAARPVVNALAAHYGACVETRYHDATVDHGPVLSYRIRQTPTTIGLSVRGRAVVRVVGGDEVRLRKLYEKMAALTGACTVPRFEEL